MVDFYDNLKWNSDGLIPVIAQDATTEEVLMLAYMNRESLAKTLETGEAVYYSRSRAELWHKGDTSGHFQSVVSMSYDCDADSILIKVNQIGVACHEGDKSCFHFDLRKLLKDGTKVKLEVDPTINGVALGKRLGLLESVIADRYVKRPEGAYTTYLFDKGIDKILKKVGEEAAEVIIGAKNHGSKEIIYEASDLIYHLLVLFKVKDVNIADIEAELAYRYK